MLGGDRRLHGVRPRVRQSADTACEHVVAVYAGYVPQLRLALAQVDATVGDLAGNSERVVTWSRRAARPRDHPL